MKAYQTEFSRIKKGCVFNRNGNQYYKKSTRTAVIVLPAVYVGGIPFYFNQTDKVQVNDLDSII